MAAVPSYAAAAVTAKPGHLPFGGPEERTRVEKEDRVFTAC